MKVYSNQAGAMNVLLIPLILVVLFFFGALGFGYWAFSSRQDYKNNSDQKSAAAVGVAVEQTKASDAKLYAEEAKKPLKSYVGPAAYGSITVEYPKTWSSYIIESNSQSGMPINAYFNPDFVPDVANQNNSFALRMQLVGQSYDTVLKSFDNQVKNGSATVAPYALPKVPNVVGSRIQGQIAPNKQGTMIIIPLRNMTLKVWTDASQFMPDMNNIILPNMSFSP